MDRLGELLVAAGSLTEEQLQQGLHSQVLWGGRLGTSLIELGHTNLDLVSNVLGEQLGVTPALGSHFQDADTELQQRLPSELAERFACLPLVRLDAGKVMLASIDVLGPSTIASIARELCVEPEHIVPAVAAELRIRYHLEKVYGIARETRFLRARGSRDLDQGVITETIETEVTTLHQRPAIDRRSYVPMLSEPPPAAPIARIQPRRTAAGSREITPIPRPRLKDTLGAASREIRLSVDREQIMTRAIQGVAQFLPATRSALFLVVRGDVAVSEHGFGRDGEPPAIAIPLREPGLIPSAIESNSTLREASANLGVLDRSLLRSLGLPSGDLVIEPISTVDRVIGVMALAVEPEASISPLSTISMATGAALGRLLREATR